MTVSTFRSGVGGVGIQYRVGLCYIRTFKGQTPVFENSVYPGVCTHTHINRRKYAT